MNNYDKMILAQQEKLRIGSDASVAIEADSESAVNRPIDYSNMTFNDYMRSVLYRVNPQDAPVIGKEEFNRMKARQIGRSSDEQDARFVRGNYAGKKSKFNLTKKGKIILVVYVILMLLLASILIVSNTVSNVNMDIAKNEKISTAFGSSDAPDTQYIRAMSIDEEKSDEGDWFDKLCDSLNK